MLAAIAVVLGRTGAASADKLDDFKEAVNNVGCKAIELPGVNHLFQATKTGAFSEYAKNPPVMDASVLDATTIWIRTHTGLH